LEFLESQAMRKKTPRPQTAQKSAVSNRELPIRIVLPPMKPTTHPFFVFWLGFLTGVLVLSLCLGYLLVQTQTLEQVVKESINF
jgi:hypothetical protein